MFGNCWRGVNFSFGGAGLPGGLSAASRAGARSGNDLNGHEMGITSLHSASVGGKPLPRLGLPGFPRGHGHGEGVQSLLRDSESKAVAAQQKAGGGNGKAAAIRVYENL